MRAEWTILGGVLMLAGLVPFGLSIRERVRGNRLRANLLEPFSLFLMACGFFILTFFVLIVRGWFWILEVPFALLTGWARYLWRVLNQMNPDAVAVASAVVCVFAVAAGAHLFLRWLTATGARPWPLKRTLQLLLLVGVLFASGLAVTGLVQQTGWLIRTPDPLVKDARSIS